MTDDGLDQLAYAYQRSLEQIGDALIDHGLYDNPEAHRLYCQFLGALATTVMDFPKWERELDDADL
jgi:hypothetical protein